MPKSWTATHDQQLLLLILKTHKIDSKVVAAAWSEAYSDDPTTSGAITQHIAKLARKVGGDAGSSPTPRKITAPTKTATPRKPMDAADKTKTPSSMMSSGRKRPMRTMDLDDDDDDEEILHNADESPTKRQQMSRKSKTPGKSYRFDESDEENAGDEVARIKLEKGSEGPGFGDFGMMSGRRDGFDGQSDVSDFNPLN